MRHFWQWFNGYVCILLRGRQLNRFINLCSRNGIRLWSIKRNIEHKIQVHIRLKDIYYLKPYLRKTKTIIHILNKKGFPFWCYKHPRLKWMFVFLACIFCIFLYSFHFIWEIEINGNQRISTQDIVQFLEQQDIMVGTRIDNINYADLEYQFRQSFHEIGWISIYSNQTKLCIEIKESLYDEFSRESNDSVESYHLVAEKDAVIHSIITRQGIPLVKKGQRVVKDEILVLGYFDIFDDSGELRERLPLHADALIYADTENTVYASMTEMEIMSLKIAGNYSEETLFLLANKKLDPIIEKIEENGVIILDKNVMIDKEGKNIVFIGKIQTREQLGINILAEE